MAADAAAHRMATKRGLILLQAPRIRLSAWLAAFGWILFVGGIVEGFDLLFHHHWHDRWWHEHSVFHVLLDGPAAHIGLGSVLLTLARR